MRSCSCTPALLCAFLLFCCANALLTLSRFCDLVLAFVIVALALLRDFWLRKRAFDLLLAYILTRLLVLLLTLLGPTMTCLGSAL